ncbi:MAG TPA: acyl-CoA synthetase [Rhizomicrobium sp.]|jgi:fatty-acyl-CoA synthase|nr:acyl-CoA synthetase [Rhizomicrobium sp.]
MPWNYGDILDAVGKAIAPDAPAFIHGERVISWGDANKRMNNIARGLIARGTKAGDKVAFYLRNCPEYTEGVGATFKGRFVHVNVNYRYKPDEVRYILDNSDATVLIYGSEFRDCVAQIRDALPKIKNYIEVNEGGEIAAFAEDYETLAHEGDGKPLELRRSPDDMLFIYTGGTTGMPKGVMWQTGVLCTMWHDRLERTLGWRPSSLDEFCKVSLANGAGPRTLPACPIMHGTGFISAITTMLSGGCVVTVDNHSLDADAIWSAVERNRVAGISIVGDPFAKPLLRALDDNPGKYDLSSMLTMTSSGAMWSVEVKRGLLKHIPQLTMTDSFASTEAMGMGSSVMTKEGEAQTAAFQLLENAIVIDEQDRIIPAGSGKAGLVALGGPLPAGYYKDKEKTARTFRLIGNRRYSVPGDWARVDEDGAITLLGRGSNCINTAGEKVYPEEVEEVLKTHPLVEDALVLGVPDDTWGQAVTGVVRMADGANFDEAEIRAHVRNALAGYKTPKRILDAAALNLRAPNGKADYKSATAFARAALGIAP